MLHFKLFKSIIAALSFFLFCSLSFTRFTGEIPDWALLDPDEDGYEGTRTLAFYHNIAPSLTPRKKVVVGIIDSGFDINHPDLKESIWNNKKEINGKPGVDDDSNGYVDDFHGWNFLGNAVSLPSEVVREYYRLKKKNVSESDPYFLKISGEFENTKQTSFKNLDWGKPLLEKYLLYENILKEKGYPLDTDSLKLINASLEEKYHEAAEYILKLNSSGITKGMLSGIVAESEAEIGGYSDSAVTSLMRQIGDNPNDLTERGYGNNNLYVDGENHGTHVAGIIGAKKETIGQAHFVELMLLRAVPNKGDERDKDIGNAIIYAVDNGADIINMSAGKFFSSDPEYVTAAINYAASKGVLFVCTAGNSGLDIEKKPYYPEKYYIKNGEMKFFPNMIVVGASAWMKKWNEQKDPFNLNYNYDLAGEYSNYSKQVVDIFAPGVEINSTVTGGYERLSGTSMAAPQVTGIACILKTYFPELTAEQIKNIISGSARRYDGLVVKKPGDSKTNILFSELSRSGGIADMINSYNAALLLNR